MRQTCAKKGAIKLVRPLTSSIRSEPKEEWSAAVEAARPRRGRSRSRRLARSHARTSVSMSSTARGYERECVHRALNERGWGSTASTTKRGWQ